MLQRSWILPVLLGAALLIGGNCGVAQASIQSSIKSGVLNGLQDTDADIVVRNVAGTWEVISGDVAEGDILVAGVGFDTLEAVGFPDATLVGANAFSMLKIFGTPTDEGTNSQGLDLVGVSFIAPLLSEWTDIVDDVFGGNSDLYSENEGTMVILYDLADANFDRIAPPGNLTDSAATISDGTLDHFAELGFTGAFTAGLGTEPNATGEGWEAIAPSDPSLASLIPLNGGIIGASFAAGISVLDGFDNYIFGPLISGFNGGTTDVIGSGGIQGYGNGLGSPVGPWQAGSDADFSFLPTAIPEPASLLAWMGLAITGGIVGSRRYWKATATSK